MATKEKTSGFSFRDSSKPDRFRAKGGDPIQQLEEALESLKKNVSSNELKLRFSFSYESYKTNKECLLFVNHSALANLLSWQGVALKFKKDPIKFHFFDKSTVFKKENLKNDLHHFLLSYLKVNKTNVEGARLLPAQESLEYIIALKEFTLERRSGFYDLLDLLKENDMFADIDVRFHLIPASEIPNINTERVEALPIAA